MEEKNTFLLGYLIGQQLNLDRDEPWIAKENNNTIKIIRANQIIVNNPELEVK